MELNEIYQELSSMNEQLYSNTYRMYWHGSPKKGLRSIKASAISGETVPLAWVSNSFDYAARYAFKGGWVYRARQTRSLNIWNPRADKDWSDLAKNYPEFDVGTAREFLIKRDWLDTSIRAGKMRVLERNDLLEAIQALGYSGVFNREDYGGEPALGVFEKFSNRLAVFDAYSFDEAVKLWRSVSCPNRVYNPRTKSFMTFENFEEMEAENDLAEVENRRQNFLEGYI
jgi:hypothetical protein